MKKRLLVFTCSCCLITTLLIPYIANALMLETAAAIGLKRVFDKEVEKTSRSLAKGALGEFNNSMKILFDNQINPLLANIDFVAGKHIDALDQAVKERIQQTENVIIKSVKAFEGLSNSTIINIRDQLIQTAANEIRVIEQKVFDDIMKVFEITMKLIDAIDCTQERWLRDIEYLLALKERALWRWDHCYTDLGLQKFPTRSEYRTFYEIHSCKVLETLDENTPIKRIMSVYHDLSSFALRTACIQRNAGERMNEYFINQWKDYEEQYQIWERTQNY